MSKARMTPYSLNAGRRTPVVRPNISHLCVDGFSRAPPPPFLHLVFHLPSFRQLSRRRFANGSRKMAIGFFYYPDKHLTVVPDGLSIARWCIIQFERALDESSLIVSEGKCNIALSARDNMSFKCALSFYPIKGSRVHLSKFAYLRHCSP